MEKIQIPLAERVRPVTLAGYLGQSHLTAEGAPLFNIIKNGTIPSMIFWGPPGVGKTTLANLIATESHLPFRQLSAISSGVADLRKIIEETDKTGTIVLFVDEIHRFNKNQQDALLGAVEKGKIILIGATTENPSFEVNSALLSRCQIYVLKAFSEEELIQLVERAIKEDELLNKLKIELRETAALLLYSGGDGRKLLNLLELMVNNEKGSEIVITDEKVVKVLQTKMALYDKSGEQHYDIISAFIKSLRGSDPNGAVYWLARMLKGGEDIRFIARRMVILASEDIGNANPNALLVATQCFQAVEMIGMPEARIILSQAAIYLATSPKSNSSYMAIDEALAMVEKTGDLPVPLHLRNAPTKLMKTLNYGKNYEYAHSHQHNFVKQQYLPDALKGLTLYQPGENTREKETRKMLQALWGDDYRY